MIEKMRGAPRETFEKGSLVKLRDDVDAAVLDALAERFKPGVVYRVFQLDHHDDEGGDAAWIGPQDTSPQDVENFNPKLTAFYRGPGNIVTAEYSEERYKHILPIATSHLKRVLD